MPSTSEPSIGSPISRVPYDVLREIFTHCLPQYPLRHQQPDTTIAPILLCHICSSWRMITLASPTLWAHLSYCLTIIIEDNLPFDIPSGTVRFVEREIRFIRWWRSKHGHIAPFLSFRVCEYYSDNITSRLTGDGMSFLLEYIASAQHLQLDSFYWGRIGKRITAGYQVIFPNLRVLLAEHASPWAGDDPFYQVLAFLPNHALRALRCLSIGETMFPPNNFDIPSLWSALTHVHLYTSITLDFWFSFICAVPNLRWGHFDIYSLFNINYTTPPKCTLFQLTTLFVGAPYWLEDGVVFPLSLLFTGLHLPALRTLSLSSPSEEAWDNHHAITELYSVLKSTPAITKLSLEDNFLSSHIDNSVHSVVPNAIKSVEPIWKYATQLVHLKLHLCVTTSDLAYMEAAVDLFVRTIFSSDSGWLDLCNPACPIQSLTINDNGSVYRLRNFIMSSIQKNVKNAPEIVPQMTDESAT